MLDHQPTAYEIAMAHDAFTMGRATCQDMEILRFSYPMQNFSDGACPVGGLFDALFWSTGLPW